MNESELATQTHGFVRQVAWRAAVLPFGATEPHNYHMPYGTDTFQVVELARRACQRAWDGGARVALRWPRGAIDGERQPGSAAVP